MISAPFQASAFFTIDSVNHLAASLLLLLALGLLRSKKSRSPSNLSLQLLCFAVLCMQLAAATVSAQTMYPPLYAVAWLSCATLWVLALLKVIEKGLRRPLSGWLRVGALCIMTASALALLVASQTPGDHLQLSGMRALHLGIYPPILLIVLMSVYALRISGAAFQNDCRPFLLGSVLFAGLELLHLLVELTFLHGATTVAYFHGFLSVIIAMLFVAGSVRHTPAQSFLLSRTIILFGSIALPAILICGFLIIASVYLGQADFRWSTAAQLVLIGLALAAIYTLSISNQFRDKLRVFVNKNFFRHKYDYRNVWLNLIQTLSSVSDDHEFFRLGLQAVGEIFDANGGAMWLKTANGEFNLVPSWNVTIGSQHKMTVDDKFIQPFIQEEWIYALALSGKPEHDRHLKQIPDWMRAIEDIWIIAPLQVGKKLVGFFLLTKKKQNEALIWEDIDVIKSTGKQLASYIVRQQSAEQLAESKQFDTYNKLTAFIMHDLKNLIAQQALVVENAKKHKENPAFVEDAIRTIDNSVDRMSQLLKRLQRNTHQSAHRSVSVKALLLEAIRKCADRQPIPTLRSESDDAFVVADQDQLVMILMHIIRNAQDATASDGFVDINLALKTAKVTIEVEDNGSGMDEEFLTNRLFKPFESTKSSMGMGIGAYQVREFIQAMNGKIDVTSEVGMGTTVCIELPIAYLQQ